MPGFSRRRRRALCADAGFSNRRGPQATGGGRRVTLDVSALVPPVLVTEADAVAARGSSSWSSATAAAPQIRLGLPAVLPAVSDGESPFLTVSAVSCSSVYPMNPGFIGIPWIRIQTPNTNSQSLGAGPARAREPLQTEGREEHREVLGHVAGDHDLGDGRVGPQELAGLAVEGVNDADLVGDAGPSSAAPRPLPMGLFHATASGRGRPTSRRSKG